MRNNQNHPKLLLIGTGSLLNYGCEAIVHGTYEMLREYWPECELIVGSDDTGYDREIFSGCENIRFIHYKRRYSPYRLLMGTLRRLGVGKGSPVRMNYSASDCCDIFLSGGGDNFAQAPDGTLYHLLQDLMKIGERAKRKKKIYALWGASVGPFGPATLEVVGSHLSKADALFPRERISYHYLTNTIGIPSGKNHLVSDPAFWMTPDEAVMPVQKRKDELLIGLNISPLSVNHSFADKALGAKAIFDAMDALLKKHPHYRFLCIPHVKADEGGAQDDLAFMQKYLKFSEFKSRVEIFDFGSGARKTKAMISHCDLLIASRMHCCVAGISTATPTLFLTYSQKGIGMAEYAYGDKRMTLPINEITSKSLDAKVTILERSLPEIQRQLNANQSKFRQDAATGLKVIKKLYIEKRQQQ